VGLGEAATARVDLERARFIEPDHRLVNEVGLRSPERAERLKSAATLLNGDESGISIALDALARDGITTVLHGEADNGRIRIRLFRQSPEPVLVRWSDGSHVGADTIALEREGALPFAFQADVSWVWPDGAPAVKLSVDDESALVVPPVLRPHDLSVPAPEAGEPHRQGALTGRSLMVIVPVYDDFEATQACFASLVEDASRGPACRIIAVDDASPRPEITRFLDGLADEGTIVLVRNPINLGFAASVNRALAVRAPDEDVLLLNADTVTPPGAIARLAAAAYSDPMIGTVTPLSNNGEDTSFPVRFTANPLPPRERIGAVDQIAQAVNEGTVVDMPYGVGFCLYVKAELAQRLGPLSLAFGRGYYEDVEYCLRAAAIGFRNVCAVNVYVGHGGTLSFKGEKRELVRRNLRRLDRAYPTYRADAERFTRTDPLKEAIGRIEEAMLRDGPPVRLVVVPEDLPDWLVRKFAACVEQRPIVVRGRFRGRRLTFDLFALDDGHPQSLTWGFEERDRSLADQLRERLSAWPVSSALLVDPVCLPPSVVAAFELAGYPTSYAATAENTVDPPTWATDGGLPVLAATATLAARLQALGISARAVLDEDQSAPAMPSHERLAILAEDTDEGAWPLAIHVARHLRHHRSIATSFLGAQRDIGATSGCERDLFVTGRMTRSDTLQWLTRLGGATCLLASRRFGLADSRAETWPRRGIPVALFDPSVDEPTARGLALHLPALASNEAVAKALAAWISGLEQT
jgi:GT2 family glycosyltransferase